MGGRDRNVLIVQETVKHYRAPFFEALHDRLLPQGVKIRVAYGRPRQDHQKMRDLVPLREDIGVVVRTTWLLREKLLYMAIGREVAKADLVIAEQAVKYLWNVPLVLGSMLGLVRLGQWGHGWNRTKSTGLAEWLKRKVVRRCDWWFAYTPGTADFVIKNGMPADRVTVTWNALDGTPLQEAIHGTTEGDLAALRAEYGIPADAKVGIYAGGLYGMKRLPMLLDAAALVKARVPDFHLLILGDGPEGDAVRARAAEADWIHTLGPTFGDRKAHCLRLADVFLCPGTMGLAVLDAFAGAIPILTTDIVGHGPEEEYLEHGVNGLRTVPDTDVFGRAVADLLNDPARLGAMQAAAAKAAGEYTMERMVRAFEDGILKALGDVPIKAAPGAPAVSAGA